MNRRVPLSAALLAAALMLAANGLAYTLRPTQRVAAQAAPIDLASMVPPSFGDWHEEIIALAQVVNPQQQEMLDKLYKQILTRTYINSAGQRIMLSIAYGGDQTDANQVHQPEVCYPAQGFQLQKSQLDEIQTRFGNIPVKRILTTLGQRYEPVTYWISVGNRVVRPGVDKKLEEMKYGLRGQIPDGLLFRISSIDRNETAAFAVQDAFVQQMLNSLEPAARLRLAGLGMASTSSSEQPK